MGQLTGSKLGKEYAKAVYCFLIYLTYMQSTSCEMLDWLNHQLESKFLGEILTNTYARWYYSNGRKWRGTEEPPDKGERRVEKLAENLAFKKLRSWHLIPSPDGK